MPQQLSVRDDLFRIVRFVAQVIDCSECFLLLPDSIEINTDNPRWLELVAWSDPSFSSTHTARVSLESNPLMTVVKNAHNLLKLPLQTLNSTISFLSEDTSGKTFYAIPIPTNTKNSYFGVFLIVAEEGKSLSKRALKVVSESALNVSRFLAWSKTKPVSASQLQIEKFETRTRALKEALGPNSVEQLKIQIKNYPALLDKLGKDLSEEFIEQFVRLVQQALPPHFPLIRLDSDQYIVAIDNMMTSFFASKISSIAENMRHNSTRLQIAIAPADLPSAQEKKVSNSPIKYGIQRA